MTGMMRLYDLWDFIFARLLAVAETHSGPL
jgi:hypothetical protein